MKRGEILKKAVRKGARVELASVPIQNHELMLKMKDDELRAAQDKLRYVADEMAEVVTLLHAARFGQPLPARKDPTTCPSEAYSVAKYLAQRVLGQVPSPSIPLTYRAHPIAPGTILGNVAISGSMIDGRDVTQVALSANRPMGLGEDKFKSFRLELTAQVKAGKVSQTIEDLRQRLAHELAVLVQNEQRIPRVFPR